MEKIVREKIKELENETKEGIDDIIRLGQIVILKEVLLEKFRREAK